MRVTATPELRDYVHEHGGVLYVATRRPRCCGAVAWVTASTTAPAGNASDELVVADGVLVCLRLPRGIAPEELRLTLEGGRKKRPVALWDGCAYVV